eukprot:1194488-Prorocentrum_minimum.AAC.11
MLNGDRTSINGFDVKKLLTAAAPNCNAAGTSWWLDRAASRPCTPPSIPYRPRLKGGYYSTT